MTDEKYELCKGIRRNLITEMKEIFPTSIETKKISCVKIVNGKKIFDKGMIFNVFTTSFKDIYSDLSNAAKESKVNFCIEIIKKSLHIKSNIDKIRWHHSYREILNETANIILDKYFDNENSEYNIKNNLDGISKAINSPPSQKDEECNQMFKNVPNAQKEANLSNQEIEEGFKDLCVSFKNDMLSLLKLEHLSLKELKEIKESGYSTYLSKNS